MKKNSFAIFNSGFLLFIGTLLLFSSCIDRDSKEPTLRFGWITSASFTGEVVGMKKFARENKINLECIPGGYGINPATLVQTGENTFGTLAADEVISAIDNGADLVIIGVINYQSPGGFVSLKEKNIKRPKDFEGRRVGVLPFGSTNLLYEIMIQVNNVNKNRVIEIPISPDLRPFLNNRHDIHPVFVYDETVTLDLNNIEYNLIEPKDFDTYLIGPVYFCKRSTLENNPELVRAFINTMADGWNYAINNPVESIKILSEFAPEISVERESLVLEKAIPYYTLYNNQPVNSDYEVWENMVDQLYELEVIQKRHDIKNIIDLTYINEYYKEQNE